MLRGLLILFYLTYATSEEFKLASIVTSCELQTDYRDCLGKNVQNAFTILGTGKTPLKIVSIEPIELTSITVPRGGKKVNAHQVYKNVKIHGFTNMTNVKADVDILNLEFSLVTFYSKLLLTSDYELKGAILKHNVEGKGHLTMNFENVTVNFLANTGLIPKKHDIYLNVTNVVVTMQPEKIHFKFTNLRENGQSVDEEINRLINDNWKEIYQDVGETYHYAFSAAFKNWMGQIAKYVTFASVFS